MDNDNGAASSVRSNGLLTFLQSERDWAEANIHHERATGNAAEVCWNRGFRCAIETVASHFSLPLTAYTNAPLQVLQRSDNNLQAEVRQC